MLNSSYISKLYFKKLLTPLVIIAIILSVATGVCGKLFLEDIFKLWMPIAIGILLVILAIGISFFVSSADENKSKKVMDIFKEEGYTLNLCETYSSIYIDDKKKPFAPHLVKCAAFYSKYGDYAAAEILLDKVDGKKLDKEVKFIYCVEKLRCYGQSGDWTEGEDFRSENIKFIQNYMEKRKDPQYEVQAYCALALVDCAAKKYTEAFSLLNFGYKPVAKNDTNLLMILFTAIHIYAHMKDEENLETAVENAEKFLAKFDRFEYDWCKEYYQNAIKKAAKM